MDLKQFRYFVTVVNEGTISAAAEKLHMTQPPLSTQLKLLEEEAGCLLFERGPRSIRLTDAGKMLYERAVTLLHMSSLLKEELREYRHGSHGTLRLGIVSSVNSTLFCQWVRGFHESHPDIQFELSEDNTYGLLDKLRNGLIELAIVRTPFPSGDFQCIPLKKEAILAAGHKHLFQNPDIFHNISPSSDGKISLEALSALPLILYRRWEPVLKEAFHSRNLSLEPLCKNDDARTTAFWADAGLGVGILPESAVSLFRNPETVWKTIDDEELTSTITLIHGKNSYLSAAAKAFGEYLRELYGVSGS